MSQKEPNQGNGQIQGPVFVGVDLGTTGAKAVLVDSRGRILAESSSSYGVSTPHPLWAEQWPEVWVHGMAEAMDSLLAKSSVEPSDVAAMAVSSLYGGSGVPVDDEMNPVRPCLIWMDRRADRVAADLQNRVDVDRLVTLSGNGIDPYYGFTKMLWVKENEPESWETIRQFVPPNSYVNHRLTGKLAVDHTSAGNIGGVYDIGARRWSEEACEMLDISMELLPEPLVGATEIIGQLDEEGARLTGLSKGTPVCAGGVDAAAATLSAGVFDEGPHVAMMGTSMCWGFVHRANPTESGLVSMPYLLDAMNLTYTFGGAATAGAIPAWFVQEFGGMEQAAEQWTQDVGGMTALTLLDRRAERVPAGSDGVLVLPYFMGERSPIWDSYARGTVTGLTLYHNRAHVYRACLEGVAFALRHNIESGVEAGYQVDEELQVVGGATNSRLWMQIVSDVTGRVVVATEGGEAAFGDAMVAAVSAGLEPGPGLRSWVEASNRFQIHPNPDNADIYDEMYEQYLGLYADLRSRFERMAWMENRPSPSEHSN